MPEPELIEQRNIEPSGTRVFPTCPKCGIRLRENVCPKCGYKRVVGYEIKPDTDMSGHGFAKSLTFKHIHVDKEKDKITVREIDYYVNPEGDITCGSCGSEFTWLMAGRTGVYKTCLRCHKTTGVLSQETGILRKEYEVSVDEAIEILKSRSSPRWMVQEIEKIKFKKQRKFEIPRKRPKKIA